MVHVFYMRIVLFVVSEWGLMDVVWMLRTMYHFRLHFRLNLRRMHSLLEVVASVSLEQVSFLFHYNCFAPPLMPMDQMSEAAARKEKVILSTV